MKSMPQFALLCALALLSTGLSSMSGCADRPSSSGAALAHRSINRRDSVLPNGAYAILREAPTETEAAADNADQVVLVYTNKYSDQQEAAQPRYLSIDPHDYVPLMIDGSPQLTKDDEGKSMLTVTLAHDNIGKLAEFTRKHLGSGKIAMVVDGEVVTIHKVRSVIEDGKVQITRCEDNACEVLRTKLAP